MSTPPPSARHGARLLLPAWCCAALLAGCAQRPLAPAVEDELPPLAAGLPSLTSVQRGQTLTAAFGDSEVTLSCGQSVSDAGWRSVCVNSLGLRVFTLAIGRDGSVTAERGAGVPAALDARRVLADVQLASWPLAALEAAYAGSRWRVQAVGSDGRRLWRDGRLAAEVHYASAQAADGLHWLVNLQQSYTLMIRPDAQ